MKQALSSKAIAQLKATDKAYIVFDSSQESPVGFGIRVTPNGTKTYLVKRRFRDSSSIKTLTIGKTRDVDLDKARALARKWIADYEAHGEVRGETQRTLAQWTLKEVMDAYVEDLSRRKRGSFVPLDPSQDGQAQALCENTASSIASARKRLALWDKTTLKDLTINKVLTEFDRQRTLHPTAAEKAFTWAKSAVDLALEREREETSTPSVHFNPFASKSVRSLYRSRTQLREHYRQSKVANPLTGEDEIKKFLTVTWSRRERRTTAVDYLLTT
ncbi:MAG: DUF4102 domain-containing protein, partial [Burkholderiales bacterium]|nr:DUF4102 domain-containing protein [Burkholderiales bacterium]